MKTGIKVCDAMTKKPEVVTKSISLVEAAERMLSGDVGSLIIKEQENLIGLITEKDIVKAVSKRLDPVKTKVNDVMIQKIVTVDPKLDLYDALVKMNKEDVRRMPVISNGKLIGLLTMKDVLKLAPILYDLRIERFEIREEQAKLNNIHSICKNCGSTAQLYKVGNKYLCAACKS